MGDPNAPWNLCSKWLTYFRTPRFRPLSAYSASTVIAGEKCPTSTNTKSTTRFPTSHRWTVCRRCALSWSPPKGCTKCDFAVFASEIKLLSKEVYYKVSLCENFQRQSCNYIIPLSNVLLWIAGDVFPQTVSSVSVKFGMQVEVDDWCTTVCHMTRSKVKVTIPSKLEIRPFFHKLSLLPFTMGVDNWPGIIKLGHNI